MPRNDGNTNKGQPAPQQPKGGKPTSKQSAAKDQRGK